MVETLLSQGKPLGDALDDAAQAVGPDGRMVLGDLVVRLRTAPADEAALAVREWTTAWDNPAVDIVATSLLASIEGRIEIGPLVASLRKTLGTVVEVLSRARAAAKGVEWQARFLALFPPAVLVVIAITTPETGELYSANPLVALPGDHRFRPFVLALDAHDPQWPVHRGLDGFAGRRAGRDPSGPVGTSFVVKGLFRFSLFLIFAPLLCGAALVVGYVLIVGLTIPQLPEWAQQGVTEWMFDIPQDAERSDNGSNQQGSSGSPSYASQGSVEWQLYRPGIGILRPAFCRADPALEHLV